MTDQSARITWSLSPKPDIRSNDLKIRAKRIDIDSSTPRVMRANREFLGIAALFDVNEYALYTGFMKVVVLAE